MPRCSPPTGCWRATSVARSPKPISLPNKALYYRIIAVPVHDVQRGASLNERAIESLEFIRTTMARSAPFTAVPGRGGIAMGTVALILHLHELLQYLNRQGATTFLTVAQHGLVGDMQAPVDVTYLADTVVLLRYFEALGRVRRAISIVKKRTGAHEDTIREYQIGKNGVQFGPALTQFQGVLRGVPEMVDALPGQERQLDG